MWRKTRGSSSWASSDDACVAAMNGRIAETATVRELLSVAREARGELNAVDVAAAWGRLAKLIVGIPGRDGASYARATGGRGKQSGGGDRGETNPLVALLSDETRRVAHEMPAAGIATALWALAKLASGGSEVSSRAARAVTDAASAARVRRAMSAQDVAVAAWALAKMAEQGVRVHGRGVRAVVNAVPRVAGTMSARHAANTLWAFGKLVSKHPAAMDVRAVRAAVNAAERTAGEMNAQEVANTLRALAGLAWTRKVDVDAGAVAAVSGEVSRVASEMIPQGVANTAYALAKLSERDVAADSRAVAALTRVTPRAALEMSPQNVANTLWSFAKLAQRGVEMDAEAVRVVNREVPRVIDAMKTQEVVNTLLAWGTLAGRWGDNEERLACIFHASWLLPLHARERKLYRQMTRREKRVVDWAHDAIDRAWGA